LLILLGLKLNAFANPDAQHRAYLCLGSNIDPIRNLGEAIRLLSQQVSLLALSACWETEAVGGKGPNFLNLGACIITPLGMQDLKEQVLAPVEKALGRVRSADKNAPRTIDLDITLYDGQVLDKEIWRRVYLALIFAELTPLLKHPETGESLPNLAERLRKEHLAVQHPEIVFPV
jgi:2-amino-4-hydroxy-6-hydroxymethyldihydropteridine diphosphokinase